MLSNAYAYIDPGSGSILLQALLAGLVGLIGVIKIYWRKIINFCKGKASSPKKEPHE